MYDRIKDLMFAIEDSDYSKDEKRGMKVDVIEKLNYFADYFNQVVRMEILANSITTWSSSDSFLYSQMDEERRFRHDLCVNACEDLNQMCQRLGIQDFYPGDVDDRHDVAAFCGVLVSNLFLHGINEERSFDDLVQEFASRDAYAPLTHIDEEAFEL